MGKTRRKFSLRIAVRDAPETVTPAVARPSKRGKNREPENLQSDKAGGGQAVGPRHYDVW